MFLKIFLHHLSIHKEFVIIKWTKFFSIH
ncbi:hypothetical protein PFAG_01166 [Plasmodium falciparum Santa Lucia]|uniref:Uncharacterized protein n=1 Tax=Plasmodium falciparum Santa Lucia TaxID=478859 RepID=W7FUV5_PLAFA|nr:hypothetical protein PFAG_01166 [Plasmodium falciparum Santa Lucia]